MTSRTIKKSDIFSFVAHMLSQHYVRYTPELLTKSRTSDSLSQLLLKGSFTVPALCRLFTARCHGDIDLPPCMQRVLHVVSSFCDLSIFGPFSDEWGRIDPNRPLCQHHRCKAQQFNVNNDTRMHME